MARLGGWQRIWLVLTGVLLAIHLLVAGIILSSLSEATYDSAFFEARKSVADSWQRDNQQRCRDAAQAVKAAQQLNAEYNAQGEAKAQEARSALIPKIEAAKARLFAVETAGGKYSQEWSKHRDAIDAYTDKLNEHRWTPRPFKEETIHPAARYAVNECVEKQGRETTLLAEMDTAKELAATTRKDIKNGLLATLASFLCFSLGIYLVGWCIGWIRVGFKQK